MALCNSRNRKYLKEYFDELLEDDKMTEEQKKYHLNRIYEIYSIFQHNQCLNEDCRIPRVQIVHCYILAESLLSNIMRYNYKIFDLKNNSVIHMYHTALLNLFDFSRVGEIFNLIDISEITLKNNSEPITEQKVVSIVNEYVSFMKSKKCCLTTVSLNCLVKCVVTFLIDFRFESEPNAEEILIDMTINTYISSVEEIERCTVRNWVNFLKNNYPNTLEYEPTNMDDRFSLISELRWRFLNPEKRAFYKSVSMDKNAI